MGCCSYHEANGQDNEPCPNNADGRGGQGGSRPLIRMAQAILKDDRHFTLVDVADRADDGRTLAEEVLTFFGVEVASCPKGCEDCKEHHKHTGEENNDVHGA